MQDLATAIMRADGEWSRALDFQDALIKLSQNEFATEALAWQLREPLLVAKIFGATLNCATTSKLNTVPTATKLLRIFTMDDLHKMADSLVLLSMTYDLPTSLSRDISHLVSELYFSADDQRRIDYETFQNAKCETDEIYRLQADIGATQKTR